MVQYKSKLTRQEIEQKLKDNDDNFENNHYLYESNNYITIKSDGFCGAIVDLDYQTIKTSGWDRFGNDEDIIKRLDYGWNITVEGVTIFKGKSYNLMFIEKDATGWKYICFDFYNKQILRCHLDRNFETGEFNCINYGVIAL